MDISLETFLKDGSDFSVVACDGSSPSNILFSSGTTVILHSGCVRVQTLSVDRESQKPFRGRI